MRVVVYIDVDDTLVRSAGIKTMSIPSMLDHVKVLAGSGAELYCWSTAGAEYARDTARRLGLEHVPQASVRGDSVETLRTVEL